jgi:hypothetical protein
MLSESSRTFPDQVLAAPNSEFESQISAAAYDKLPPDVDALFADSDLFAPAPPPLTIPPPPLVFNSPPTVRVEEKEEDEGYKMILI